MNDTNAHRRTQQVSDEDLDRILGNGRQRVSLLVYHRDGARMVALREAKPIVVGSDPGADVHIRDPRLSRRHARFELSEGDVWVEDLGSLNGTRVDGRPIEERRRIDDGHEVLLALGAVSASIHQLAPAERQMYGLDSHDRFLDALEEEVERARAAGGGTPRSLALLMVTPAARRSSGRIPLSSWCPRVRRTLHRWHRMALYGPGTVEILAPELDEVAAGELARRIVASGEGDGDRTLRLRCGVAMFPAAAVSGDALLERARLALRQSGEKKPIQFASRADIAAVVGDDSGYPKAPGRVPVDLTDEFERIAPKRISVLILGETGTGKEVLARAIHERSPRRDGPFVVLDCSAIPRELIESQLFGHEKGAFTNAISRRKGFFEQAHGGTILLDEIGELPYEMQAKLLRVLQERELTRVGGNRPIAIDVRVIAATNRPLQQLVAEATFREDLYHRLEGTTFSLHPLRERTSIIEALVERFIAEANAVNDCHVRGISREALDLLHAYPWPGNIRELRNVIERAVVIADDDQIGADDLPAKVRDVAPPSGPAHTEPLGGDDEPFNDRIDRYRVSLIERALRECGYVQTEAAKRLQMPLRTLVHYIKKFEISTGA